MRYSIYTLTNPLTNSIFYVGKSVNLRTRFKSHLNLKEADNELKNQIVEHILLHSAMPVIEEIDFLDCIYTDDEYLVHELEIYWIHQIKAWGFDLANIEGLRKKAKYVSRYSHLLKPTFIDEIMIFLSDKAAKIKNVKSQILASDFPEEEKGYLLKEAENAWDESILEIEGKYELGLAELLYNKEPQNQLL